MEKKLKKIIAARYAGITDKCSTIAARAGVSYQCIYYILKGKNALSLAKFIDICAAAGLNPAMELKAIIKELKEKKDDK